MGATKKEYHKDIFNNLEPKLRMHINNQQEEWMQAKASHDHKWNRKEPKSLHPIGEFAVPTVA